MKKAGSTMLAKLPLEPEPISKVKQHLVPPKPKKVAGPKAKPKKPSSET
jgi:hypothetical protein